MHSRIAPPHIIHQLDESQGGFRWGADVLVASLVSILSARSSSHTFVAFIDIQKAFAHDGSRGLWCGFLMLVSGAACGASCANSCMARSHKFVVALTQNPGWTLAKLKADSSLHCFSTSPSTAPSRRCDKLPLICSSVPRPDVFQVSCMPMILSYLPSASLICRSLWTLWQDGVGNGTSRLATGQPSLQ